MGPATMSALHELTAVIGDPGRHAIDNSDEGQALALIGEHNTTMTAPAGPDER